MSEKLLLEEIEDLVREAPVGLCYFDVDLRFVYINEWLANINGLPVQEHLGKRFEELLPDVAAGAAEQLHRVIETGEPVIDGEVEAETPAHPEERRTYQHSYYPRESEDGKVIGVSCIVQDITEARKAHEALHESEGRYRGLFESAIDMIHSVDADHRIDDVNQTELRKLGYSRSELIGRPLVDIIHPDFRATTEENIPGVRAGESITSYESALLAKDGTKISVIVNVVPRMVDGQFQGAHAIIHDITDRRELEERFRQSQKMEAIGQLSAGIAHDFNNLLQSIEGYTQMVLAETPGDSLAADDLRHVLEASERATHLTRQLLAFGRRQPLQVKPIDLEELVAETCEMLRPLITEAVELEFTPTGNLGPVQADPTQIEQVLINLALNARDAMPDGGKLFIETTEVTLDEAYAAEHVGVAPGSYGMFAVSDTGIGMNEETRLRAFEPFFTTKETDKGSGLGLSTVFGIIKQLEGSISVYSEPGKGTCFKVCLPRVDDEPKAVETDRLEESPPRGDETILLVDDEETVQAVVQRGLQNQGYTVVTAASPEEAEQLFQRSKGEIALLVTDVVMPGCDGPELHRRLADKRPSLKVLFMSGYAGRAMESSMPLTRGLPFISKPFGLAELAGRVRQILDT